MRFLTDHFCDLETGRMRAHLREQHADLGGGRAELVELLGYFGIDFASE
jgi:hypothetical protein